MNNPATNSLAAAEAWSRTYVGEYDAKQGIIGGTFLYIFFSTLQNHLNTNPIEKNNA